MYIHIYLHNERRIYSGKNEEEIDNIVAPIEAKRYFSIDELYWQIFIL